MTFLIAAGCILLLIFLGMSIPYTFMAGSALFCVIEGAKMNWFASTGYYSMEAYSMLAMPLFIVAGSLLEKSGIASRLVDLGEIMLRKVKGGLAATIPVVSAFFGALSGSGLATASTMCTMLGPRLFEKGWDRRYVAAFVAASAPLGFLIPPNVNAVVYSMVSECSIASLFVATVIPAALLLAFYLVINRVVYTKWYHPGVNYNDENAEVVDTSEAMTLWQAVKRSLLAFLMPVIILGGIYSGIFTATEAGAISCLYGLFIGCFVYKTLKLKNVFSVFRDSVYSVATMMMIFPFTFIFSRVMVTNGVPQIITEFITSISSNRHIITLCQRQ